jgi:ABC-2 type transport system permease protein
MPPFWKYFSYIFPSSLGMNAYPRIMSMGCTLQDIRPLYIGLWAQVLVYFTTSCFVYLHHIKKFVSFQEE